MHMRTSEAAPAATESAGTVLADAAPSGKSAADSSPGDSASKETVPTSVGDPQCSTVAAVVLAAGAGTRFAGEQNKLLVEIAGKPVVRHAVDAARAAGLDEVVVVTGSMHEAIAEAMPEDVTVLHNESWEDGQSTSLQAAVSYADWRGHGAVVVGLGDSPGVAADTWRALADSDAEIAMADFAGRLRPPTRLAAALWPSLPVSGDEGARSLVRARPDRVVRVKAAGDASDIDTLSDLQRWR